MGMFQVRVKVTNPADADRSFEEDFRVDTGAVYTFVPEDRLREIGVEPLGTGELILPDGRRGRRLLGEGAGASVGGDTVRFLVDNALSSALCRPHGRRLVPCASSQPPVFAIASASWYAGEPGSIDYARIGEPHL